MAAVEPETPRALTVRHAVAEDAQAIGVVFDAALRHGWSFLGEVVQQPMFAAEDWDQLVADHSPPNTLLVAADPVHGIVGYTAVHADTGEMFLLFVHPTLA